MQSVMAGNVPLEYEIVGSGEPVLLISPLLADGFLPLLAEPALADDYRLIHYHRRGWAGSTHTPPRVMIADHASDAAALLEALGITRAHVAGHSSGAAVALQFALDYPERLHSLALLELLLLSLPAGQAFVQAAAPVFEAYASGDHEGALATFLSAVSGLDWPDARRSSRSASQAPWRTHSQTPTPSSESSCRRSQSGGSTASRPPPSTSQCYR